MPIHSLILSLNDTTKTHNSPDPFACKSQSIKIKAGFGLARYKRYGWYKAVVRYERGF